MKERLFNAFLLIALLLVLFAAMWYGSGREIESRQELWDGRSVPNANLRGQGL
jgi:hypothetical protein